MVSNADKIIAAARSHIGVREQPEGTNDGPELRALLTGTGFRPGLPWCMFFVLACLREAFGGFKYTPASVLISGSCQEVADHARAQGKLTSNPATGAVFLLHNDAGHYHHAGIVAAVNLEAGTIEEISGNSNNVGAREGFEVVAHTRPLHNLSFVIW